MRDLFKYQLLLPYELEALVDYTTVKIIGALSCNRAGHEVSPILVDNFVREAIILGVYTSLYTFCLVKVDS